MADKKTSQTGPTFEQLRSLVPETPKTQLANAQNFVTSIEMELDNIPYSDAPGSKYQKKLAEYNAAKEQLAAAKGAVGTVSSQEKSAAARKKVTDLQEQRSRLIDKGVKETDSRVKKIDEQLSKLSTAPSAIRAKKGVAAPAGERPAPEQAQPTSAETGDGQFKFVPSGGVAQSLGPTGGTPIASTPSTGGKVTNRTIDKTAWVSWMRQTFKTLDDTNERNTINGLLNIAKQQNWTEQQFLDSLDQRSAWWRNTLPTLQQFFLDSNDPRKKGQFDQRVSNHIDAIEAGLERLGVNLNRIDPITGKVMTPEQYTEAVKGVALEAMKNGWNDAQIQNYLATKVDVVFSGGGTIGTSSSRVKSWADRYGISLNDSYVKSINASLLDPNDGRDEQWWYNEMQRQAAEQYSPFAGGLSQGRTLQDMTSNYRDTMANLLEVDPMSISWKDLMGYAVSTDDKGNQVKTTMSDFVKKVKQNPMWQTTRNAKETYTSMGMDLLKEFGIVG